MLDLSLQKILRTTPAHLKKLEKMGITTVRDLLEFFPRAIENTAIKSSTSDIQLREKNTLQGELVSFRVEKTRYGKRIAKADFFLQDQTKLEVVWFAVPYNLKGFTGSRSCFLVGKVKRNFGKLSIQNPEVHFESSIHVGGIRPIYSESPPITSKWMREKIAPLLIFAKEFPDTLPSEIRERENLMTQEKSITKIHFPKSPEEWFEAKKRLGFEEIFEIQIRVMKAKILRENQKQNLFPVPFGEKEVEVLKQDFEKLPFQLTQAQKKVLKEILEDLSLNRPMHRLVQGDVGAGKTIVAFLAALQVARAGYQVAILAPTEILAKQHFSGALKFFPPDIPVEFLAGSTTAKNKELIKTRLKSGDIKIIIGTHAILTEDTIFKNLGLGIVDEQHRFGVKQRNILAEGFAHILAMTATPIPRSLALTIYGDQDLSIIDEKPAGRKEIITRVIADQPTRRKMELFTDDQIAKGRQIFWVCPLVDESDKIEATSVAQEFERISKVFHNRKVEFLHGKMKAKEKEAIMARFKNQEFDILVSTSVIEVGVDIPNSTIMTIENAERFGLSQLHQFRGRIGRNDVQSYCFLMTGKPEQKNIERLKAMEKSNDGFYLSEVDLNLRGAGEVYGVKQSGIPDLKCADLSDIDTMKRARDAAEQILQKDFYLEEYPELRKKIHEGEVYF